MPKRTCMNARTWETSKYFIAIPIKKFYQKLFAHRIRCYKELTYRQHPSGVLDLQGIGLDIQMVESGPFMHVNFVIIFQMCDEGGRNISSDWAFGTSVRAVVRPEPALFFMLYLLIVRGYIFATRRLVPTIEVQRLCYPFQSQAPYITQLMIARRASVVHFMLTLWTESVAMRALQLKRNNLNYQFK